MVKFIFITLTILCFLPVNELSAQSGEDLFKQRCVACHTIGKGKLVGPDLSGVHKRKPEDWLVKFIKSSQTVINSGDEYAKQQFEEYNKVIMPDAGLNDAEIKQVLDYIAMTETTTQQTTLSLPPLSQSTPQNVDRGKQLFSGESRLKNGGASCVSCHNVPGATVLGGGNLAKDLTEAYTRLSEAGLTNVIASQPFPVMKQSYVNNSLADDEVYDLACYLKEVDHQKFSGQPASPENFLYAGIGGTIIAIGLIAGFWYNRRKRTVNFDIYKRQEDFIRKNS